MHAAATQQSSDLLQHHRHGGDHRQCHGHGSSFVPFTNPSTIGVGRRRVGGAIGGRRRRGGRRGTTAGSLAASAAGGGRRRGARRRRGRRRRRLGRGVRGVRLEDADVELLAGGAVAGDAADEEAVAGALDGDLVVAGGVRRDRRRVAAAVVVGLLHLQHVVDARWVLELCTRPSGISLSSEFSTQRTKKRME